MEGLKRLSAFVKFITAMPVYSLMDEKMKTPFKFLQSLNK